MYIQRHNPNRINIHLYIQNRNPNHINKSGVYTQGGATKVSECDGARWGSAVQPCIYSAITPAESAVVCMYRTVTPIPSTNRLYIQGRVPPMICSTPTHSGIARAKALANWREGSSSVYIQRRVPRISILRCGFYAFCFQIRSLL